MPGTVTAWWTTSTLGRLWPFVAPEKRRLVAAFLVTAGLTVVEVATPVLVGLGVDGLLAGLAGRGSALLDSWHEYVVIAALLVAAPVRGILLSRQRALEGALGQRVTARIRKRLWSHLQRLPVAYANRRGPGRLLLRFLGDARAIQRMAGQGLVRMSQDLLVAAGILVALAVLNWRMSLAVLPLVPIQALIFWRLNTRLRKQSRSRRRRRSRLSAYVASRASGFSVVKNALANRSERDHFNTANRGISKYGARVAATSGNILGLSATAVAVSSVLVLIVASGEATAGRLTAGTLVSYYVLIGMLAPIFQRVAVVNRSFQEGRISVERITQTLAEAPEILPDGAPALVVHEGTISAQLVSFQYEDEPLVLDEVSFEARRGEIVAVTGPSGAGKSTLLELLLRFQHPTVGRILIDGQDIAEVRPDSLRAQIGYVPQRPPLFDGTAAENVTIGAPEKVTEEDLERVARLSGIDEVVVRLPNGWKTKLAEGRRGLSGGERVRFALARALLPDPPILVLDEPGSALDDDCGHPLAERLRELAQDKTIVIVGGSLPAPLVVDRMYRLDRGRLTEMIPGVRTAGRADAPQDELMLALPA